MAKVFQYQFKDPSGAADTVNVTVNGTVSDTTGSGPSYSVTAISGTINGAAITGQVGAGGTVVTTNGFTYDNAIFPNAQGVSGNAHGIDIDGLFFSINGVDYNLYAQNGVFTLGV